MPQTVITFGYNLVIRSKNSKMKKTNGPLGKYGYGYNIFLLFKTNHEGLSSSPIYHMAACMRFFSDNFCLPTTPLSKGFHEN